MATTSDISNDSRRVLYILLADAEGGGPTARVAEQAQDEEPAEVFREAQEELVGTAKERLARSEVEPDNESARQKAHEGIQVEEFAERAARRLETVADRLEQESRRRGAGGEKTLARAWQLRVAAFMVRDEARVVARNAPACSPGAR
jgi:hypothetical protein